MFQVDAGGGESDGLWSGFPAADFRINEAEYVRRMAAPTCAPARDPLILAWTPEALLNVRSEPDECADALRWMPTSELRGLLDSAQRWAGRDPVRQHWLGALCSRLSMSRLQGDFGCA